MISFREPVYQSITETPSNEYESNYPARRRQPLSMSIKDRLTKIVSMHVSSNHGLSTSLIANANKNEKIKEVLVEEGDIDGVSSHFGLLALKDIGNSEALHRGLCNFTPLLERKMLFASIAECLSDNSYFLKNPGEMVTCLASDRLYLYVCIETAACIFQICLNALPSSSVTPVTRINLKLSDGSALVPNRLSLKQSTDGQATEFYVIGHMQTETADGVPFNLLACFSVDGKLLAQTKKYSYQRYLALDVDADGCILLACNTHPNDTLETQICKLTPYFERRIFSLTMRKGHTAYQPQWITKACAGGFCWASVQRSQSNMQNAQGGSQQRMFSFPGSQPVDNDDERMSPKKWLKVVSWSFDAFSTGSVLAVDFDRLLAVDIEKKSLAVITWAPDALCTNLQRITRPCIRTIDHFCSPYSSALGDMSKPTVAYLISEGDLYQLDLPK